MTESGLNEKLVRKLAKLARLALDDAEVRALVPELAGIVRHVDSLRSVDTTGVPPMTHGAPLETTTTTTTTATLIAGPILGRRAIEQSAGYDDDDGMVKVPRVVE
ncbi:MAG: Asp-tRNA(Asn)/Glu-tRNA(Gln) amidotransferase subunit GatC [Deltaproteobacteria bacterium]|nr:Asp-tRNA(Asn)/Glu-tRNA(Gln) amidotransferase subunit GatC [Deltaproteobacteria bacterium]